MNYPYTWIKLRKYLIALFKIAAFLIYGAIICLGTYQLTRNLVKAVVITIIFIIETPIQLHNARVRKAKKRYARIRSKIKSI